MSEATPEVATPEVTPAATPEVAPSAPADTGWDNMVSTLPEEVQGSKFMEQFKGKEDPFLALVTEGTTATSLIGSQDRIARPKADAPTEEWDKFYNTLGRPEKADGYDFGEWKPTEGLLDDGMREGMMAELHEGGATNQQATRWLKKFDELGVAAAEAGQAEWLSRQEAATTELKTEWGEAYDGNCAISQKVLSLAPDADQQTIVGMTLQDGTRFVDSPAFARFFHGIAMKIGEDNFIDGDSPANRAMTPEAAKDAIAAFDDENADKIIAGDKATMKERNRLYAFAFPAGSEA